MSAWIKIHQILNSFETTNISFSSNFPSIFNAMSNYSLTTPLYFFTWNFIYFLQKEPIKLKLWWNWNSEIWHFSQNNIRFQLKKVQKSYLSWHWRVMPSFKKKLTCSFKYDMRNFVNFHQTTQKSQNFTLMVYFCPKCIWGLSRGIIFHDTEQWCKIWIKADLVVSRMAWGIGWTIIKASKVWKIIYWWVFLSKVAYVSVRKFGIIYHDTAGWCK